MCSERQRLRPLLDASIEVFFMRADTLQTDFRSRVAQLDYGFAFFNDPQKELIVFGGLHVTDFEYVVQGSDKRIEASTTAILPLIGARARLNPTKRIAALVSLEKFAPYSRKRVVFRRLLKILRHERC